MSNSSIACPKCHVGIDTAQLDQTGSCPKCRVNLRHCPHCRAEVLHALKSGWRVCPACKKEMWAADVPPMLTVPKAGPVTPPPWLWFCSFAIPFGIAFSVTAGFRVPLRFAVLAGTVFGMMGLGVLMLAGRHSKTVVGMIMGSLLLIFGLCAVLAGLVFVGCMMAMGGKF